jgi:hypothetical protein
MFIAGTGENEESSVRSDMLGIIDMLLLTELGV